MSAKMFSPVIVGLHQLRNRIVMAPMTRNRAPQTIPTPLMATYYLQRASAGLIITEATQISPQGVGYPATPGIHSLAQIEGWKAVTAAVHGAGGLIFLQLWHVGRISHPDFHGGVLPVAPSAIAPRGEAFTYSGPKPFVTPRALEPNEISVIVEDYRKAAANAMAAGFDGVEIHAANGYLIDQFLRDGTNRRTDDYGGSVPNRARLLLEVTAAVAAQCGSHRVGVRLSPWQPFNDMHDSNPAATFGYAIEQLNRFRLAYVHIIETGRDSPAPDGAAAFDLRVIRRLTGSAIIVNGGYDKARAAAVLEREDADAVAFGQLYLANPDLVERFATDAPLNAPDPTTFYGGDEHGYTDYPRLNAQRSVDGESA